MKKILYFSVLSLLGLAVSCAKEDNVQQPVEGDTIAVTVVPEFAKTSFNNSGHSSWTEGDALGVAYAPLNLTNWIDSGKKFDASISGQSASFSGSIDAPAFAGKYNLYAIHPYKQSTVWTSLNSVKINIPASQFADNESFDSNADILISDAAEIDITKTTSSLSDVRMSFARVNSIARVRTGGISLSGVSGSDAVLTVKLSTDADVALTGDMTVDFADYTNVSMSAGKKEVTLGVSGATLLNLMANMNVAPVTIPSGSKVTIEIATLDYTLSKTTTLTSDWVFAQNDVKNIVCKIDNTWTKTGESSDFQGSGTKTDPYLIRTFRDMVRLSQYSNDADKYVNYTNKYYKMTADIDMTGAGNFTPISSVAGGNTFKGVFDGDNHCIYNLTISSDATIVGLFGYIGYKDIISGTTITTKGATGTVKNLKIGTRDGSTYDGVSLVSHSGSTAEANTICFVSVLCSQAYNTDISNIVNYVPIEVSGSPTARYTLGTFASALRYRSLYDNCVNYGEVRDYNVESDYYEQLVGGMFGTAYESTVEGITIKNCTNYGDVVVNSPSVACVGGLLANIKSAMLITMTSCKNYGNLKVKPSSVLGTVGARIGGIGGYLNGMAGCAVTDCENYADLKDCGFKGLNFLGGIAGGSNKNTVISGCKNYGDLEIMETEASYRLQIGGITGQASAATVINNCVNEGNIKALRKQVVCLGGIVAILNNSTCTNCTNKGTVTHDMTGISGNANWQSIGGVIGFVDGSAACTVTGNVNEATGIVSGTAISTNTMLGYGGVIGIIKPTGTYSNNTNKANVTASNTATGGALFVGGVVGSDYNAAITAATGNVNSGNVSATGTDASLTAAGGIIGNNALSTVATGNKSFGAVTSNGQMGAVAGINAGKISNSVVSGSVGGTALTPDNFEGFLCSANSGTISGTTFGTE